MSQLGSFAQDTLVRAIKTFCQALAALLVADGTGLLNTMWGDKLSVAGMAALLSVLTTVGSGLMVKSPAIGEAVTPDPQVVVKDTGSGPVAADASVLVNDTPVVVAQVGSPPPM